MLNKKIVVAAVGAVALMGAASSFAMSYQGHVGLDAGFSNGWTQSTSGGATEKKNKFIYGANAGVGISDDVGVSVGFVQFAKDQVNNGDKHWAGTLVADIHPQLNDKIRAVFQAGGAYHVVDTTVDYKKVGAVFGGGVRYAINSQISAQILAQYYAPVNDDNTTRQYTVVGGVGYAIGM